MMVAILCVQHLADLNPPQDGCCRRAARNGFLELPGEFGLKLRSETRAHHPFLHVRT